MGVITPLFKKDHNLIENDRPVANRTFMQMRHSVKKKTLSKSKSDSLIEAHHQKNLSRSEKISSHDNFNLPLLGQNAV